MLSARIAIFNTKKLRARCVYVFRVILNNIQPWLHTQNSPVGLFSTGTLSGRVTLGTCCWFISRWDYAGDNGRRSHVSPTDADCQQPTHHSGSSSTSHRTGGSSTFWGRVTHPKAPASTAVHGPSLVGRCSWVIFGWPSIHSWPGRLIYIRSERRQLIGWACQGVF